MNAARQSDFEQPDYSRAHQERWRKGMTLMPQWEEHRTEHASGRRVT